MSNKLNVDRLMQTLSEIMSEKHGVVVKFTATRKEEHKTTLQQEKEAI